MSTPSGAVLLAAPPTLHRSGLDVTLRGAWPELTLRIVPDPDQLSALLQHQRFALVIADSTVPGSSLLAQLLHLRLRHSSQQMLLLTDARLSTATRQQIAQSGYPLLSRNAMPTEVVATVGELLARAGSSLFSAPSSYTRPGKPATALSRRELEVLRLVVDDCCNQEIADRLYVSVRTVESHRRALLQKTGAKTLVGLVVQAVREGWVQVA
ncbi:response regulator transcription factor [Hymenobacter sp. GOD-10R]|uniref:helix-turn-helix transcriptional regulator n=1 Tax=Hymenobacter sp. GOD-10R TaxID=3093922 RepID=UPI002D799754|nr:response regulator transcription factor [Hymenobacter sp. GOD-10R]WRQ28268.1 response regulator transcription factor [Hymenobacter sp. GOD-10R]